jgi:hypothetical protein
MKELKTYPEGKRRNIERGFDIQLAFDHWFDQVYSPWFNGFAYEALQAPRVGKKAATFDDYLAVWAKRESCVPQGILNECGPVPDWRSDKWRAKEQEIMRAALDEAQRRSQKK